MASSVDFEYFDCDNHYYEAIDAFTRHLDPKFRQRGVRPVQEGKRVQLLVGGKINNFVPNPTFDPIIVPGCLDPLFRGQIPEGVDPRSLPKVEPLPTTYRNSVDRVPRSARNPNVLALARLLLFAVCARRVSRAPVMAT